MRKNAERGNTFLRWAEHKRGAARTCIVFQGIAGPGLGCICSAAHRVTDHAAATIAVAACIASVPGLQANSQSAALATGNAPIASATIVEVGFTA